MNRISWTRYLVAAALILLVGAVWSLAGEEKTWNIQVKIGDGQEEVCFQASSPSV